MISTHCGVRLYRETTDNSRLSWHQWRCQVCRKRFKQHKRLPKAKGAKT